MIELPETATNAVLLRTIAFPFGYAPRLIADGRTATTLKLLKPYPIHVTIPFQEGAKPTNSIKGRGFCNGLWLRYRKRTIGEEYVRSNAGRYRLVAFASNLSTSLLLLIYPPDTVRFDDRAKRHVSYVNRRTKQVVYGDRPKSLHPPPTSRRRTHGASTNANHSPPSCSDVAIHIVGKVAGSSQVMIGQ
jgi:hypothetical protein